MERAGNDDSSHPTVVLAAASSDCGVDDQVEDTVTAAPTSSLGQELFETSKSEPHEEDKESLLTVVRVMLGTPHTATFFAAVGLSGMGAGIINTFLFIRYVFFSICVVTGIRF